MKSPKKELPLDDLFLQITKWRVEAASSHNDGWTRQHYQRMLDEVKRDLNKSLREIEEAEMLDNYD